MLDRCAAHPKPVILALPGVRGCCGHVGGALQGDDQAAVEGPDAGAHPQAVPRPHGEYARAELRNAETGFYIWGRASRSRTIDSID